MATIDLNDSQYADTRRPGLLARFSGVVQRWRLRRQRRATLINLSEMQPYLLRDMGIEPGDVYDALDNRNSAALFNPLRQPERH